MPSHGCSPPQPLTATRRTVLMLAALLTNTAVAGDETLDRRRMPAFHLRRPSGEAITRSDLSGRWAAVLFGYTSCPDICPTTMAVLSEVFARLGSQADRLRGMFVTVDPARDTPEVLQAYVAQFSPRILAATGTAVQVKAAADAFGLKFSLHGNPSATNYTVDHAAVMLLFDPHGSFVSLVPHGASADEIVALLARHGVRAP